ncbi:hypothetical protein LPB140_03285 [Sphingorhabdus lutea]|uniref:Uncharacterized protein n=1 Tax=Sphingorhabdus lutea TaxID=1913578 RepID=A0A1L3J9C8_9SPHN|nr:hypothetical protein LPB140_01470 [Sphingorhabdus lutea]APG62003.1 hypothetical protein LPB140_03285 [Sphingorhabdus lutea]
MVAIYAISPDAAGTFAATVANIDGQKVPRNKSIGERLLSGFFVGWLFEIVGLDEGTCGQRLQFPGTSRFRIIGKI